MRVVLVAFYGAYPPVSGAAAVTFNLAKFLPAETLLIQTGERAESAEVEGLRVMTLPVASPGRVARLVGLPAHVRAIIGELSRFCPDVVILEGASWAIYHWTLLRAIRRAIASARVVYHAHNVEYVLRRERNGPALAAITRFAESRLLKRCDLATAVSDSDRGIFQSLYGVETILLPNGIDSARFGSVPRESIERVRARFGIGDCAIVFSGLYAYPPNREAVEFLRRRVMPIVLRSHPDARLVVTGAEIRDAEPWIVASGVVPHEDLPAVIAACRVAAAPVFSGSGTRLKILEAMAGGVPVVATAKGAQGLPVRAGEHLLLADAPEPFAEAIEQILESPMLAARLRGSARQLVNSEYDWRKIATDAARAIADSAATERELARIPSRAALE